MIKIKHVGICGTDLHAFAGNQAFFTYPRILGHELSGEIVEIGKDVDSNLRAGDEVVVIPYRYCGKCYACRKGKTNCCSTLSVFGVHEDGGMRDYFSYDPHLLLPAPGLDSQEKAIVEPLCIGTHAVDRSPIADDDWVIVSGIGPIGVGILWAAQEKTNRIIAIDVNQQRLEFCKQHFAIEHTLVPDNDVMEKVREITGGDMAQVVFDATGVKGPMEKAIDYLSPGGRYILVGLNRGDLSFNHPSMHSRELSILCSRNATVNDFHHVIKRMQNHEFPSNAYITHDEGYQAIPDKFAYWRDPKNQVMKVVTAWNE
ncbi:MAG: zinc-binding alcohol dehydrogenase family protein [Saprospiraceae bacterium]|nr:zinc-binding alcohol dehydrogenase family protein [Saprospiraceae bacterium]